VTSDLNDTVIKPDPESVQSSIEKENELNKSDINDGEVEGDVLLDSAPTTVALSSSSVSISSPDESQDIIKTVSLTFFLFEKID